ncbi:hypothetical protein [Klebsiella aerogenes]|uniref:hypothetical protein n=1 Tax=Klebsiella aerogenes TaxID=548 RepID=UPI0018686A23|nr:hypothetical protein [Klebsiella aerogenes]
MKRLILAILLSSVSAGAFASSMTCSGNGIANTFESDEYSTTVKINGVDMIQNGQALVESNGNFQVAVKAAYGAIDGFHQALLVYKSDIKHPLMIVNLDNIEGDVNGGRDYSAALLKSHATFCNATYAQEREDRQAQEQYNAEVKRQQKIEAQARAAEQTQERAAAKAAQAEQARQQELRDEAIAAQKKEEASKSW